MRHKQWLRKRIMLGSTDDSWSANKHHKLLQQALLTVQRSKRLLSVTLFREGFMEVARL